MHGGDGLVDVNTTDHDSTLVDVGAAVTSALTGIETDTRFGTWLVLAVSLGAVSLNDVSLEANCLEAVSLGASRLSDS